MRVEAIADAGTSAALMRAQTSRRRIILLPAGSRCCIPAAPILPRANYSNKIAQCAGVYVIVALRVTGANRNSTMLPRRQTERSVLQNETRVPHAFFFVRWTYSRICMCIRRNVLHLVRREYIYFPLTQIHRGTQATTSIDRRHDNQVLLFSVAFSMQFAM